jgi:hypothetical protein
MHQRTFLRLQARAEAAEATHLNNGRGQLGLVAKALIPRLAIPRAAFAASAPADAIRRGTRSTAVFQ